jgi:hypothetical protein
VQAASQSSAVIGTFDTTSGAQVDAAFFFAALG